MGGSDEGSEELSTLGDMQIWEMDWLWVAATLHHHLHEAGK